MGIGTAPDPTQAALEVVLHTLRSRCQATRHVPHAASRKGKVIRPWHVLVVDLARSGSRTCRRARVSDCRLFFKGGRDAAGQQHRVTPSYEAVARSPKGCLSTGCEHGRQNPVSLPESRRLYKTRTRAADQPRCTNLGRGMQADPGMKRCRIHRIGLLKISSIWLEMPTNRGRQREIPRDPCSDASWQSSHLTGAKETLKTVLLCSSRDNGGDVISVGSARGSGFGDFQLLQLPMRFSILRTPRACF